MAPNRINALDNSRLPSDILLPPNLVWPSDGMTSRFKAGAIENGMLLHRKYPPGMRGGQTGSFWHGADTWFSRHLG
jgi:hypothetical protein